MRDARFLECLANRRVSVLQIEAFRAELRMQNRTAISALACHSHQEDENLAPDSARTKVRQHRHPADLHLVAMGDKTAAPDWLAVKGRQRMKRARVVLVEYLRQLHPY